MNKIMILGANTLQIPLIQEAKKEGIYTIVVSPVKSEKGFEYADECVYLDLKEQEKILEVAREKQIDGIITDQTDIPVRTVAYVSENMGLSGIGYKTACLFTDKYLMRERIKEMGIKVLEYKITHNIEEAIEFFHSVGKDVILKPVDNQGSKGVYKISSEDEMIEKYPLSIEYSKQGSVLVEEFVTGEEFVVEGIVNNYNFENLVCGDTHYFDIPDVFSATTRIFPSMRDKSIVDSILEYNKKIITGFGLKQGITHSEYIVCNGDIYLIETAARGGGVFISSDLISLCTGLNTEKFLLNTVLGKQNELPKLERKDIACCYLAFFLPVGEIESLEGLDKICDLDYTHRNNFESLYIGKKTTVYADKTARYFTVISAKNHKELMERIDYIKKNLNIKVKTIDGLQGPIWE